MSENTKLEMLAQRIEGQDMEFRTERRFLTDEESDLIVAALRAVPINECVCLNECLKLEAAARASSPAQETRFDSVAQRIERSEPDEGRKDAGSNPVAIGPAQEPVTTEPVAWRYRSKKWSALLWRYQTEALVNDDFETLGDWLIEPLYALPAPPQPGREWPEGDKVGIDPDLARALAIEECAQWHERKAELETNSLHCGDNSATIAAAHRVSVFHKACARDLRFDLTGEPK